MDEVLIDLPAPVRSCYLVGGGKCLYGFVCRRGKRGALIDDFDVGRSPRRSQGKGDHRNECVREKIYVLNSVCRAIKARIDPYRSLVASRDGEYHAVLIGRNGWPNKHRVPVIHPSPFALSTKERPRDIERRVGDEVELLARMQRRFPMPCHADFSLSL